MLWRRGTLRDAREALLTANEQIRMWGAPEVSNSYAQAFLIRVLLDQGDTEGRAPSSTASGRTRDWATARGWSARPTPRCSTRRAAMLSRSLHSTRSST
jgi:hypothetical protein